MTTLSVLLECNHAGIADAELIDLEKKVSFMVAQTDTEEEERDREQNLHNLVHLVYWRWLLEIKMLLQNLSFLIITRIY